MVESQQTSFTKKKHLFSSLNPPPPPPPPHTHTHTHTHSGINNTGPVNHFADIIGFLNSRMTNHYCVMRDLHPGCQTAKFIYGPIKDKVLYLL